MGSQYIDNVPVDPVYFTCTAIYSPALLRQTATGPNHRVSYDQIISVICGPYL
jgi:hypothetical protein